jgi:hypothetical protein
MPQARFALRRAHPASSSPVTRIRAIMVPSPAGKPASASVTTGRDNPCGPRARALATGRAPGGADDREARRRRHGDADA